MAIPGPTGFQRTEAGLAGAAFLAPFSATHLGGPLTVGRATILVLATMLATDVYEERVRRLPTARPYLLLAAAYLGLWLWVFVSSAAWGCNCDGKLGGFTEFVAIGLLAATAIVLKPRLRGVTLVALLAGLLLAAFLALVGVGSINSQTVDLTQTGGRLSGSYGNANELGFAAALGVPIALAYRSFGGRTERLLFLGGLLALVATIVLTYSRGAVIAAAAGSLAVLLLDARGSRRRIAVIVGIACACAVAAATLYTVFENERKEASFEPVSPALRGLERRDLSGWDSRALGPIPRGPSEPFNRPGAIAVRADRAGEGISRRWGEAERGRDYTVRLRARSPEGRVQLRYALGDASRTAERAASASLGQGWRRLSLSWRPELRSPHATFYAWRDGGSSTFELADVSIVAGGPGAAAAPIELPEQLEGSAYDRLIDNADRSERRYIESRIDAADLALDAFRSEPLRGIGWSSFPDYAAANLDYGELAIHDQYLGIVAELGIVGVLFFALLVAAIAIGIRGIRFGVSETAAAGVLIAAAAGMVFVEALPTPQLSIPIALAAAVLCGQRRIAST